LIELNSTELASVVARMLDDKLAKDIVILDISNVSILADYFVICSADSTTQVRTLTSFIREKVKELTGRIPIGEESDAKNRWNLLDYGEVIVHILYKEERQFYALEKFWNHACTLDRESWIKQSENIKDKLI
jgi:ribosome-associated protein